MTYLILLVLSIILGAYFSMMLVIAKKDKTEKKLSILTNCQWATTLLGFIFILSANAYFWDSLFDSPTLNVSIITLIGLYIYIIFAFKLPAHFMIQNYESLQPIIRSIYTFLNPFLSIFTFFLKISTEPEPDQISEEDIREMISAGNESGEIDTPQKEIIENVFELDDKDVEEICTHRSEVIALYLEDSMETWQATIHDNRHTFYPVCGEDEDDVVGVLDTRDYFRLDSFQQDHVINKAMDEAFYVAENTKVNDLFYEMKNRRNYFAVVLDEYGGMTGIVTLHDIMETLLGEMNEEDDEIEPDEIQRIDNNQWWIYGSASIEDVEKELNIKIPNEDYDTFSGYILDCFGRIPEDGTKFEVCTEDLIVSVKEMKSHRIGLTVVQKVERDTNEDEETTNSN